MIDPTTEPDPSSFTQEEVLTWLDKQDIPKWITVLSRTMITLGILTVAAVVVTSVVLLMALIIKGVLT